MSGEILDAIDGALRDWETSPDAMRWQPPEERPDEATTVLDRGRTIVMVGPAGSGPDAPTLRDLERMLPVEGISLRLYDDEALDREFRDGVRQLAAASAMSFRVAAEHVTAAVAAFALTPPRRPVPPPHWWSYPQDGEAVSRHVSGVCRGWLCDSCTDRSCAHTCHGGHLR